MKTVSKKLLSLMLVAIMLVSAVPFQAFATEGETTAIETTAAVETTEAAVSAVAEEAPETTAAAQPEETLNSEVVVTPTEENVKAVGDTRIVKFLVDGHVFFETSVQIGNKLLVAPSSVQVLEAYADYYGNYNGKQFNGWSIDGFGNFDPITTNIIDTMVASDGIVYINAKIGNQSGTVLLVANGGTCSSYSHTVTIGSAYGALPTPKRDNYTFLYWYKTVNGKEVPVNGETIVTGLEPLSAKWELNKYTVSLQRYDGSNWVTVKDVQVNANTHLAAIGAFPTDEEIKNIYALAGYTIVGWEIGETDVAFNSLTLVTKNIVARPRYQRSVTLMANNPGDYTSNSTKSVTVEIGEPVPALPNPGAREGYTFVDWVAQDEQTVISTKENLTNVNSHPEYYPNLGTTFHARWTTSQVVYLYIHTNGNTQTAAKIVPYYEAPASGAFDTKLINMYSIFADYGKYDDNVDASYGWYSKTQWKNYCSGTAANAATTFYNVGSNMDYAELHIMLIDNGNGTGTANGNNYNNNTSTADPSNPTTGDYIMMAVIVMAVSAAALALIFFMKKRKSSK